MVLKALELCGFKSFPDKTRLDFDNGMTAVVGPNGSGKSNIGDAILWVLGEQSTKNLRGDKMEDVIFSGTNERSQVNIAYVSLILDNRDRELDIDDDEVIVKRKLYRSGESEYKINGNNVRLKDIYELFMDTGIGKHGYSMVGQGRIAEIISAKSSDRREIFEEAAGISKFKYRKREAEKRLLQTEDNLNRALDIKLEIEDRIEPLKVDSEKAERFLLLSQEKKTLEISIWVNDLNKIHTNLQEYKKEIDIIDIDIKKIIENIECSENKLESIFFHSQDLSIKMANISDQNTKYEEELSIISSNIAVFCNDIEHNDRNTERLNNDVNTLNLDKNSFDENVRVEVQNITILEQKVEQKLKEIQNLTNEFMSISTVFGEFEVEKQIIQDNLNKGTLDVLNLTSEANRNIEKLNYNGEILYNIEGSSTIYTERVTNITRDIEETNEYINEINDNIAKNKNIVNGYSIKYQGLKEKNGSLVDTQRQLKDTVFELIQKLKMHKNFKDNMEGFYNSVKTILKLDKDGLLKGVHGTVAQIVTAKKDVSLSIETALGGSLQNIVTEDDFCAKSCIRYLKEKNLGRATFLPLTNIRQSFEIEQNAIRENDVVGLACNLVEYDIRYTNIVKSLLGRILVVKDIETANYIGKKYKYKFKIVTLDGQVINAGGSFTGGSSIKSSGIFTRDIEINELQKALTLEQGKLNDININVENTEKEIYEITGIIKKINDRQNEMELDIKSFDNRLSILNSQLQSLNEDNEVSSNTLSKLNIENEKLLNRQCIVKKELLEKENAVLKIKEQLISFGLLNKTKIEEKDKIAENLKLLQIENTSFETDLGNKKINLRERLKNKDILDYKIKQVKDEILVNEEHNENILKEIQNLEKNKLIIDDEKRNNKDKISELIEERNNKDKNAVELRKEIKLKMDAKEKVMRERVRLEEKKMSIQEKYDFIISRLWDDYEMTRTDAEIISYEICDIVKSKGKLQEIKNSIKNLGSINVSAIEEYKIVKERYDFLVHQINDINTAKIEIKKLINDITDNMKIKFKEIFTEININFKRIFGELFGGGYGELILLDEEDILNSGIEINISPPGKKVKNISLLSGGEKSFVAIAIYFAIFHVKPASFCILDEIEAALDDVNVMRFAKYIKNLSNDTQFIAITHRRGTMEEADVLYGITMQKEGISKCVKLDSKGVNNVL